MTEEELLARDAAERVIATMETKMRIQQREAELQRLRGPVKKMPRIVYAGEDSPDWPLMDRIRRVYSDSFALSIVRDLHEGHLSVPGELSSDFRGIAGSHGGNWAIDAVAFKSVNERDPKQVNEFLKMIREAEAKREAESLESISAALDATQRRELIPKLINRYGFEAFKAPFVADHFELTPDQKQSILEGVVESQKQTAAFFRRVGHRAPKGLNEAVFKNYELLSYRQLSMFLRYRLQLKSEQGIRKALADLTGVRPRDREKVLKILKDKEQESLKLEKKADSPSSDAS